MIVAQRLLKNDQGIFIEVLGLRGAASGVQKQAKVSEQTPQARVTGVEAPRRAGPLTAMCCDLAAGHLSLEPIVVVPLVVAVRLAAFGGTFAVCLCPNQSI
jgi:hypothetical protein